MDAHHLIQGIRDRSRPLATRISAIRTLIPRFLEPFSEAHVQAWQVLVTISKDPTEATELRTAANLALSQVGGWWGEAILTQQLGGHHIREREQLIQQHLALLKVHLTPPYLGAVVVHGRDPRVLAALAELTHHPDPAKRAMVQGCLASLGEYQAVVQALRDETPSVWVAAAKALRSGRPDQLSTLDEVMVTIQSRDAEPPAVWAAAVAALSDWQAGKMDALRAERTRIQALDGEAPTDERAAEGLEGAWAGLQEAVASLEAALAAPDPEVRRAAQVALRALGVRPFPTPPTQPVVPPHLAAREASLQYGWVPLLVEWSWRIWQDEERHDEQLDHLADEVIESGWLGYPGATEAQLVAAEQRLGQRLPPSYREFLQVANGWRSIEPGRFLPIEQVDRFEARDPAAVQAIQALLGDAPAEPLKGEQSGAGEWQEARQRRLAHLRAALQISEWQEPGLVYLLNPAVVTPEGEWEAWRLYLPVDSFSQSMPPDLLSTYQPLLQDASCCRPPLQPEHPNCNLPEVQCWPSFWEMVQGEYTDLLNYLQQEEEEEEEEDVEAEEED
jgi:hypothetical protein